WFPMNAEIKENRFHRTLELFRRHRKAMTALEGYVIERNNSLSGLPKIGGVRFVRVRVPVPKVGTHVERFRHEPLMAYPAKLQHAVYWTTPSRRVERCETAFRPNQRGAIHLSSMDESSNARRPKEEP